MRWSFRSQVKLLKMLLTNCLSRVFKTGLAKSIEIDRSFSRVYPPETRGMVPASRSQPDSDPPKICQAGRNLATRPSTRWLLSPDAWSLHLTISRHWSHCLGTKLTKETTGL